MYGSGKFEKSAVYCFLLVGFGCLLNVLYFSTSYVTSLYFIFGCLVYLVGLVFYLMDEKPYYHTVWHIFVVLASYIHIVGTI